MSHPSFVSGACVRRHRLDPQRPQQCFPSLQVRKLHQFLGSADLEKGHQDSHGVPEGKNEGSAGRCVSRPRNREISTDRSRTDPLGLFTLGASGPPPSTGPGNPPSRPSGHVGAGTGPSGHRPPRPGCGPHTPGPPRSLPGDGPFPRPPSPGNWSGSRAAPLQSQARAAAKPFNGQLLNLFLDGGGSLRVPQLVVE